MGVVKGVVAELTAVLGNMVPLGRVFNLIRFFLFILFSNFLGLLPYIFTSSRHLRFTLSLALPFWVGCILWSMVFQYKNMLVHLVPVGTPAVLIPVMVIIETIRNLIRPGALAVRLAANSGGPPVAFFIGRAGGKHGVVPIRVFAVRPGTADSTGVRGSVYSGLCVYHLKNTIPK